MKEYMISQDMFHLLDVAHILPSLLQLSSRENLVKAF